MLLIQQYFFRVCACLDQTTPQITDSYWLLYLANVKTLTLTSTVSRIRSSVPGVPTHFPGTVPEYLRANIDWYSVWLYWRIFPQDLGADAVDFKYLAQQLFLSFIGIQFIIFYLSTKSQLFVSFILRYSHSN